MVNIVLVDDDVLALTNLKQMINVPGICIAGEFTQAEQALEYIMQEQVDILITDMKIPKVDGIELIKRVKKAKPSVRVIAVSSYEDFHYVKESFREGSIDYILKHTLNEESISRAIMEAASRIEAGKKETSSSSQPRVLLQESLYALKANLPARLLRREAPAENDLSEMDELGIAFNTAALIVVACETDDYRRLTSHFSEKDTGFFLNSVVDLMERMLAKVPITHRRWPLRLTAVVSAAA